MFTILRTMVGEDYLKIEFILLRVNTRQKIKVVTGSELLLLLLIFQ